MRKASVGLILALTAALLVFSPASATDSLPLKLLVLPSPGSPEIFRGDGATHVAYELLLANFTEQTIRIDSLDIAPAQPDNRAQRLSFGSKQLRPMFSTIAGQYLKPQAPVLKPAESGIIFLFLDAPSTAPWDNALAIVAVGRPNSRQTVTVQSRPSQTKPVVIGSPLRGKNWWTPNGPANDSIHRRAVVAVGNHLGLPERFAVDWIRLGADGDTYSGPESDNRSYHCYNAEILAVADGAVLGVKDGIPENVPHSPTMAVPITMETIGGNYVLEDIGNGQYAFYAHMIPGTVAVKKGDRVKRGQLLGRLGNSGNSSEPHLHFHICDAPDPLLSNGLPFEIDHFIRYDYKLETRGDHAVKFEIGAPHEVTNEIFMNRDLAEFTH